MTGKDLTMMILAFIAGLVLVTIIFGGSPQEKSEVKQPEQSAPVPAPAGVPGGQMVGLGEGYFVYHSPQDRFFLCRQNAGRLEVLDVYHLARKEPTYHAGVPEESRHGWSFESMSQEKEAVLEAKCRQFEKAASEKSLSEQDWARMEKLAQEIAAVGGIDFLKNWLEPDCGWGGRRAAGLALAELSYPGAVPVLAEMLLEGPEVRERAARLLVKLTGKDFLEGSATRNPDKAIRLYKEWYVEYSRKEKDKR
jgi:hypothetical protein